MEDGKGKISFSLSREGKNTIIDVTDTGKGIDAAYQNGKRYLTTIFNDKWCKENFGITA